MFAWMESLFSTNTSESGLQSGQKLRARMRRQTEELLGYELELARNRLNAVERNRAATATARLGRRSCRQPQSRGQSVPDMQSSDA
jgi:hypothetical protein